MDKKEFEKVMYQILLAAIIAGGTVALKYLKRQVDESCFEDETYLGVKKEFGDIILKSQDE